MVSDEEAQADGFIDLQDMIKWMGKTYGIACFLSMDKLTLQWVFRWVKKQDITQDIPKDEAKLG